MYLRKLRQFFIKIGYVPDAFINWLSEICQQFLAGAVIKHSPFYSTCYVLNKLSVSDLGR